MTTFGSIVRRGGGWLPLIGVCAVVGTASTLALPVVLGRAVDAIVAGSPDATGGGNDDGRWLAMAIGLVVVGIVVDLVDAFAGTACVADTTAWLRDRLIRHLLAIGTHGPRRFDTGDLVSRVCGNAVDAAQAGPSVVTVATAVLPPIGSLVLLTVIDAWLAAAFLVGVLLVLLVLRAFARRTAEVVVGYQRTQGRIAGRLAESLAGARTISAAGTLDLERRRILKELPDLHDQGVRSWRVLSRSVAQAAVVGPLVLVAVLCAGGLAMAAGRVSAGELFAAGQYAALGAGLGGMTGVFGRLARARAGSNRAEEVFGVQVVEHGGRPLPDGPGRLEFHGVSVRAADVNSAEVTLLDRVHLTVPGGAVVAVVGMSGAGKSVLAELAARLRDPDEGQVLLDGVPLPELSHDELRSAVGCAFERPVLVGGTVADAMGMGRDLERVRTAARATHAHEFVSRLPGGYTTPLAQAPMSGGEAQRLGLARAWHAERLLVLDDATSSLDMVTEMRISQTLTSDHSGRTRLVVTHRMATAARADLVVWLEGGRVRAVAPHERLWQEPAYREVFG